MSGFEPMAMAALETAPEVATAAETILPTVVENAGTTALMGEVMGLPSLGASIAPTAMNGLATIAPEVAAPVVNAVVPATTGLGAEQVAQLAKSTGMDANMLEKAVMDGGGSFAEGMQLPQPPSPEVNPSPLQNWQAAKPTMGQAIQAANLEPAANTSALENYMNAREAAGNPFASAEPQLPSIETLAGQVPAAQSMASAPGEPGMFDKALNWMKENKLSTGLGALNAYQYMNKKLNDFPEDKKYSGPLSKFKYNKDVYQPYVATPPINPYRAQYTDYRRYASGGQPELAPMANSKKIIKDYVNQAHGGDIGSVLSKATSGDPHAMAALDRLQKMNSQAMAGGGLSDLGGYSDGGRMLKGPGDGMSDDIPATIAGKQPARLANDEFVVPADVVSHLGNGSSEAGAKQLYKMMDRVRQARTGTKKQGKQINPEKYLA